MSSVSFKNNYQKNNLSKIICINRICHWITNNGWYVKKHNQPLKSPGLSKYCSRTYKCCYLNGLDVPLISFSRNHFPSILGPFQVHKLQMVSLSSTCYRIYLVLRQDPSICLSFRFLLFSFYFLSGRQSSQEYKFFFFQSVWSSGRD